VINDYLAFIERKQHLGTMDGFDPLFMPDKLFDFQKSLVDWSLRKGRCAIFADCGLGKTAMALVWAENVVRKTNGRVLILTPLAVGSQFVSEGIKFGVECLQSRDGSLNSKIVIANYERLHYFKPEDFEGVVCDESAILKNFDGETKKSVTDFMRKIRYRMLGTATPSPNDYIELGTSSEALGEIGYVDMLKMFFKADNDSYAQGGGVGRHSKNPFGGKFRFRGHAEKDFWRWVCSWARAIRKPSDLGFDDRLFTLPALETRQHMIKCSTPRDGMLIALPAHGLQEQREERRKTLTERCETAAELITENGGPSIAWCHLNPEGDLLEKLIPGAAQVSGSDSIEHKEETLDAFRNGEVQFLVSKPDICGHGLNFQHCAHQTFFPSHSFEQWYQAIRRSWRFGQTRPVQIDVVTSEGESRVLANLQRKSAAAETMFERLVSLMSQELKIEKKSHNLKPIKLPAFV